MAVLIAITMIISSSAGAVHALTTLKAPYAKSSVTYPRSSATTGCSSAALPVPANWSPTSGVGRLDVKNVASTCKGYYGTSHTPGTSTSLTTFQVAIPVHPKYATTSIQTTWLTNASGTQKISHSGKCPLVRTYDSAGNATSECFVDDIVELYSIVYLVDTTSGSVFYGSPFTPYDFSNSSSWYTFDRCVYFTCTPYSYSTGGSSGGFSVSVTNTSYINGTFNPADHYVLVTFVEAYIDAEIGYYDYPTTQPGGSFAASATASINLASGGEQSDLKSIVLV